MSDGILGDLSIKLALERGEIQIDPFTPEHLNITSYDLTLGDEVRIYNQWVENGYGAIPTGQPVTVGHFGHVQFQERVRSTPVDGSYLYPRESVYDTKHEPSTTVFKIPDTGWVLKPGLGYLMHTRERVKTNIYNPILDGKSSIGRLFIQVHATAGYGDPGFDGQYTLEVIVQHPVRVYAGMRICQIRFHTVHGLPEKSYADVGHYKDGFASGAVASQAWRQFSKP
jgi:dCTP deaminase